MSCLDRFPLMWAYLRPHPPLDECCHEPMTAAALRRRRQHKEFCAAEEGKKEPRVTDLDIYALVVCKGFRNTADDRTAHKQLIVHVRSHCSPAMWQYCFKNRARLPSLIDDLWQWETMATDLAFERMNRIETLHVAANGRCVCGGQWVSAVVGSFISNEIDVKQLCEDVLELLQRGRSPDSPLLVLAGACGG